MKKLLALVLALIMVLGLGVTAFAADELTGVKIIELAEDDDDDDEDPIEVKKIDGTEVDEDIVYLAPAKGGDFYFSIKKLDDFKDVTVSATGNVTAELVEYDPEDYEEIDEIKYYLYDKQEKKEVKPEDLLTVFNELSVSAEKNKVAEGNYKVGDYTIINKGDNKLVFAEITKKDGTTKDVDGSYAAIDAIASALNKKNKTTKYVAKTKADTTLLKVTVAENYSAAYKEGTVKVDAKLGKDKYTLELTIISDVTIFEYEEVKWAAEEDAALLIGTNGYSDYKTAKLGYGTKYDSEALKNVEGELGAKNATVVSTTAFRAIEGEELTVAADANNYVEIEEIVKGQKGVNFAFEGFKFYDEDDEKLFAGNVKDRKGNIIADNWKKVKGDVEYITFGFLGNQVINSDFTIYVNPQISYYELRELFGKKVEEEDVLTYYVLKDGVKIDEFTVDYKDDDVDDYVELEILGKAGDKLGFYTLTLDAPAAEEGEENPNTGAESVVGVVAAMAVVSLVAAAAVSLKK